MSGPADRVDPAAVDRVNRAIERANARLIDVERAALAARHALTDLATACLAAGLGERDRQSAPSAPSAPCIPEHPPPIERIADPTIADQVIVLHSSSSGYAGATGEIVEIEPEHDQALVEFDGVGGSAWIGLGELGPDPEGLEAELEFDLGGDGELEALDPSEPLPVATPPDTFEPGPGDFRSRCVHCDREIELGIGDKWAHVDTGAHACRPDDVEAHAIAELERERFENPGPCPHGNPPHACDACDRAGDHAFDADREARLFGR